MPVHTSHNSSVQDIHPSSGYLIESMVLENKKGKIILTSFYANKLPLKRKWTKPAREKETAEIAVWRSDYDAAWLSTPHIRVSEIKSCIYF